MNKPPTHTNNKYQFDVEFVKFGRVEWVPYGIPGDPPAPWETNERKLALDMARRFAAKYNKRTRVCVNNAVHGFVTPNGVCTDADETNRVRW